MYEAHTELIGTDYALAVMPLNSHFPPAVRQASATASGGYVAGLTLFNLFVDAAPSIRECLVRQCR
jgi:hypothetical protein